MGMREGRQARVQPSCVNAQQWKKKNGGKSPKEESTNTKAKAKHKAQGKKKERRHREDLCLLGFVVGGARHTRASDVGVERQACADAVEERRHRRGSGGLTQTGMREIHQANGGDV